MLNTWFLQQEIPACVSVRQHALSVACNSHGMDLLVPQGYKVKYDTQSEGKRNSDITSDDSR